MPRPSEALGLLGGSRTGYGDGYSRFSSLSLPFNVLDYGARPTLAQFQTRAFQDAIDDCYEAGGGVVYAPAGAYAVERIELRPRVLLRGAGGNAQGAVEVTTLYQGDAPGTILTMIGGASGEDSGGGVADIRLATSPANATNAGGILVTGMSHVMLRRVGVSGCRTFGIRFTGGAVAGGKMYNEVISCSVQSMQQAADACYSVVADDAGSRPDAITFLLCHANSNSVWLEVLRGAFSAPDSIKAILCNFIASASVANCLDLRGVNGLVAKCRLETVAGGGTLSINLSPPAGSQPAAHFEENTYAAAGGTTFTDSGTGLTRSPRLGDWDGVGRISDAVVGPVQSPGPLANGNNNDYALPSSSNPLVVRIIANAGGSTLTGIAGGYEGRVLTLLHTSGGTLTIQNDGTAVSTAANCILTGSGANIAITQPGAVTMIYDSVTARWRVTSVVT